MTPFRKAILGVASWEAFWWARRVLNRANTYDEAWRLSRAVGKPLVVIGAPDRGVTGSPEGDLTIDIGPSNARNFLQADITKPLPLGDNCCVVFVSCVLEYVGDVDAAVAELLRVSGGLLFVVRVEPWTLTAYLYPGARRTVAPMSPRVPTLQDARLARLPK